MRTEKNKKQKNKKFCSCESAKKIRREKFKSRPVLNDACLARSGDGRINKLPGHKAFCCAALRIFVPVHL
jgi:hypothetical protein